jgi:hypothetical protein
LKTRAAAKRQSLKAIMGYYTYDAYRSIILLMTIFTVISGFVVTSPPLLSTTNRALLKNQYGSANTAYVQHSMMIDSSSVLLSAEETWRQYVPLIVSVGIIGDILLGNPLANLILAPMKRQTGIDDDEKNDNDDDGGDSSDASKKRKGSSKARIDAEKVAREAIFKAQNTLELRKFLDDRKTDYDRMEDLKKELDSSMQDLDEDMAARQKKIDERKKQ